MSVLPLNVHGIIYSYPEEIKIPNIKVCCEYTHIEKI
jgi:hypothetical protein